MRNNRLEVVAYRSENPFNHGVSLYARRGDAVAMPLTLEQQEVGLICDPVATLEQDQAQNLMDTLWDCGLRPSEGTGSAGVDTRGCG